MDIVILFAPNFPELAKQFVSLGAQKSKIIDKDHEIYDLIVGQDIVHVSHESWNFICMNIDYCFEDDFQKQLKKLSKNHELYMFAINASVEGFWFEKYENGELKRHWMGVEDTIEGNMGEYLLEEHTLNYPFIDESYEDVGQEVLYELIYEITNFDITETF